jgi:hypothetical protein
VDEEEHDESCAPTSQCCWTAACSSAFLREHQELPSRYGSSGGGPFDSPRALRTSRVQTCAYLGTSKTSPMGPGRNGREITNPNRMYATSWLSKCLRSVSDRGMRTALGRLRWVHELLPAQSTLLHRFDQQCHVVIAPYHPDRIIPKASSFRS